MTKVKVLFVCYGNICRSPLAEFVFRNMLESEGLGDRIETASCGTSGEHIGDPVDPRSSSELLKHGISCDGKRARRLSRADFEIYDYIIGMDRRNIEYLWRMSPPDNMAHIALLMDYAGGGEVADPWYTGDFPRAYRDIERGCRGLLDSIKKERSWS